MEENTENTTEVSDEEIATKLQDVLENDKNVYEMIQDIYGHIANIYKIISDIGTNSDVAKEAIEKIVIPVGTMGEQLKVLSTTLNNIELELVKEVVYDLLKKRAVRLALISIPIVSAVVGFLAAFLAIKVF